MVFLNLLFKEMSMTGIDTQRLAAEVSILDGIQKQSLC